MTVEPAGTDLKHALLERLFHYYHAVGEALHDDGRDAGTSTQIADFLHMDDTQVRKDMAFIGVRGIPRVGFRRSAVLETVSVLLGFDRRFSAIVVGAGRLGGAISSYKGFERYGLRIAALFDSDPNKTGLMWGEYVVQPMEHMPAIVGRDQVRMAVLTVPAESTQEAADKLVEAGVRAIWNFAPAPIVAPDDVFVRHEHISVGLAELSYHLKKRNARDRPFETA